jgi:hypothetical protein
MRAIIIEDKDGAALCESLQLSKFQQRERMPAEWAVIEETHRQFHYVVVLWLQSHGWKVNP